MPLLRTPSKGDHDKGNGHDFFELLFFALSCRQKISRKDAVAPSINFQKCGRTEHLAARAGKPDTLMPREVKNRTIWFARAVAKVTRHDLDCTRHN